MRPLISKYPGSCRKCGREQLVGSQVLYEKRIGVFCVATCEPSPEELRAYRQEAADRKADRLEEWAGKRQQKASALEARNAPYRGDIAFATQPGHIPERARAIARTEKAAEHMERAWDFQHRADRLRSGVRVKGDADRARQAKRDEVRAWLKPGMDIETAHFGKGKVLKVNQKTAKIGSTGTSGTYEVTVDLSFIRPLAPRTLPILGDPATNPDLDPDRLRADWDEVGGL